MLTACYTNTQHATQARHLQPLSPEIQRIYMLHKNTTYFTNTQHASQTHNMLHKHTTFYTKIQHATQTHNMLHKHTTQTHNMLHKHKTCFTNTQHATQTSELVPDLCPEYGKPVGYQSHPSREPVLRSGRYDTGYRNDLWKVQ